MAAEAEPRPPQPCDDPDQRKIQLSLKHLRLFCVHVPANDLVVIAPPPMDGEPSGAQDVRPFTPSIEGGGALSQHTKCAPSLQEVHLPRPFFLSGPGTASYPIMHFTSATGSRHLKHQKFAGLPPRWAEPAPLGVFGSATRSPTLLHVSQGAVRRRSSPRRHPASVPRRLPASFSRPIRPSHVLQLHFASRPHVSHFH